MRNLFITMVLSFVLVGCSSTAPGPVVVTEIECRLNSDCDFGSYCDPFLNLCGWDCREDAECGVGEYCSDDNGRCLRSDLPPVDLSPVLEVIPGNLSDVTIMNGTNDAELFRFDIVNRSGRNVVLRLLPVGIMHEGGEFAEAGSFTDVKFVDRADLYTLTGPQDLNPEVGANIYLDDEIPIPAGETTTLVLRADLGSVGRYLVTVGSLSALLEDIVFADTLERVPAELMQNNRILGRVIDVLPAETSVPGMVSVYMEHSGMNQMIDAGTVSEVALFHIDAANDTDEMVRLSDLRIRVTAEDSSPWMMDGVVALGAIDVYDSRDGSWLLAPPGSTGCGTLGCTFIFDGITLAPGESTQLEVRVRINTPGRRLFMAVGESFFSSMGATEAGAIFHRIANSAGDVLPADSIVGNQSGFYYVSSR
jgi:hypothetical protein